MDRLGGSFTWANEEMLSRAKVGKRKTWKARSGLTEKKGRKEKGWSNLRGGEGKSLELSYCMTGLLGPGPRKDDRREKGGSRDRWTLGKKKKNL